MGDLLGILLGSSAVLGNVPNFPTIKALSGVCFLVASAATTPAFFRGVTRLATLGAAEIIFTSLFLETFLQILDCFVEFDFQSSNLFWDIIIPCSLVDRRFINSHDCLLILSAESDGTVPIQILGCF
jgi:hypothetical protein